MKKCEALNSEKETTEIVLQFRLDYLKVLCIRINL